MGIFDFIFKNATFGRTTLSPSTESLLKSEWEKIDQLIKVGNPSSLRQALIFADRALDTALKGLVSGETMGERLKNAKLKFDSYQYNLIWEAHKMRNAMVHEAGFEPPYYVVKKAIDDLRQAVITLGVRL